ncbi:MAG: metallopeptidase family protein [Polyangiaceae bacterium]|nr:metallopeptidase family protein [Polyangiaceae bacterium]
MATEPVRLVPCGTSMARYDDDPPEELSEALDEIDEALEEQPARALELARALLAQYPDEPEVELSLAEALWLNDDHAGARRILEALVKREPELADARHSLAFALEEVGDTTAMIAQFLEVLRLDTRADREIDVDWKAAEEVIAEAAAETLAALPSPFRERLAGVPVLLEPRPGVDLVREGFDPRSLGLFDGLSDVETQANEMTERPTRIVLYSANLVACFGAAEELAEEVEVTVLHEVGHFFGLDEDDMERLGLA